MSRANAETEEHSYKNKCWRVQWEERALKPPDIFFSVKGWQGSEWLQRCTTISLTSTNKKYIKGLEISFHLPGYHQATKLLLLVL